MKKVEVYFLINLGAILSLFAIEGELSIYMRRQNDILLTAADDKLKTLVQINNVKSNFENEEFYQLTFDLDGEYEKGTVEFEPSFTTPILDVGSGGDVAINDSKSSLLKIASTLAFLKNEILSLSLICEITLILGEVFLSVKVVKITFSSEVFSSFNIIAFFLMRNFNASIRNLTHR